MNMNKKHKVRDLSAISWRMRVLSARIARHQTAVTRRAEGLSYTDADIMTGMQFDVDKREFMALKAEMRKIKVGSMVP